MKKYFQSAAILGLSMISACQTAQNKQIKQNSQNLETLNPNNTSMNYSCMYKLSNDIHFCIEYQNPDKAAKSSCIRTDEDEILIPAWQNAPCPNTEKTEGCFIGTDPQGPSTYWYYTSYYFFGNIEECPGTVLSYQGSDKGQLPPIKMEQQYFKTGTTDIWDKKISILAPVNSFTLSAGVSEAPKKIARFSWEPSRGFERLSVYADSIGCSTYKDASVASNLTLGDMKSHLELSLLEVSLKSQIGSMKVSPNGAKVFVFNGEESGQSVIVNYLFLQSLVENGDAGLVCGIAVYYKNVDDRQKAMNMSSAISNSFKCENCR